MDISVRPRKEVPKFSVQSQDSLLRPKKYATVELMGGWMDRCRQIEGHNDKPICLTDNVGGNCFVLPLVIADTTHLWLE